MTTSEATHPHPSCYIYVRSSDKTVASSHVINLAPEDQPLHLKMGGENILKLCFLIALISAVYSEEWKASVVNQMDALVSSCVVVPCSFSHPKGNVPTSRLRGKWHRNRDKEQLIFSEDPTTVLENFRGRTRLLGELGKGNCTLEMTSVKDHDNGPFCFRIELAQKETDTNTKDKFSFVEECVTLNMLSEPVKPTMTYKKAIQGHPFTIACSVTHTCPTAWPQIKWSRGSTDDVTEHRRNIYEGLWELNSILTFIPQEKDDHQEITCTALFNGAKTSDTKMTLYVKRYENYNYIIIPTVVALGSAAIFGGLCLFMVKKYKRRIAELQSQDGTMFNRLSRLSRRIRGARPRESHSDPRPENNCAIEKFSKARFPSPKSKPKSHTYNKDDMDDDYMNNADMNVYGNL